MSHKKKAEPAPEGADPERSAEPGEAETVINQKVTEALDALRTTVKLMADGSVNWLEVANTLRPAADAVFIAYTTANRQSAKKIKPSKPE